MRRLICWIAIGCLVGCGDGDRRDLRDAASADASGAAADGGDAVVPSAGCDLPDYFVVSPDHALEGSGWHRLFLQGGTAQADDLGRFGMTELRHEVANDDHFLLSPGALVEWVYPVNQALTGRVFGHIARTNDPDVVVRYELYLIHAGREIELFTAEDSAPGDKGYTPFEECFEMPRAEVAPEPGDRLLLRALNLTGGMLGIVTRAPDYFSWLDLEVR
jgi:hypothetical protein